MKQIVRTGIDRLPEIAHRMIIGRRIGLVTNPTGITADFRTSIEVCADLPLGELTTLFACEHGLYGERQAGVRFDDEIDPKFGVPVYSLYGANKKPTAKMLENVDTVLFDIQDLGVRFYTYLPACFMSWKPALNKVKACWCSIALIRLGVNHQKEGCSFRALNRWSAYGRCRFVLALRLGNGRSWSTSFGESIVISRSFGWKAGPARMEYTDTNLPWIMPSPNIPTIDTVRTYTGTCFFEGTNFPKAAVRHVRSNGSALLG